MAAARTTGEEEPPSAGRVISGSRTWGTTKSCPRFHPPPRELDTRHQVKTGPQRCSRASARSPSSTGSRQSPHSNRQRHRHHRSARARKTAQPFRRPGRRRDRGAALGLTTPPRTRRGHRASPGGPGSGGSRDQKRCAHRHRRGRGSAWRGGSARRSHQRSPKPSSRQTQRERFSATNCALSPACNRARDRLRQPRIAGAKSGGPDAKVLVSAPAVIVDTSSRSPIRWNAGSPTGVVAHSRCRPPTAKRGGGSSLVPAADIFEPCAAADLRIVNTAT